MPAVTPWRRSRSAEITRPIRMSEVRPLAKFLSSAEESAFTLQASASAAAVLCCLARAIPACRALSSPAVVWVSARALEMDMPMVAGRAASGINEAHLRRIVAGFSRFFPGVHTRAGGKAPQAAAQDPICGISPPETSVARQAQRHAEGHGYGFR